MNEHEDELSMSWHSSPVVDQLLSSSTIAGDHFNPCKGMESRVKHRSAAVWLAHGSTSYGDDDLW